MLEDRGCDFRHLGCGDFLLALSGCDTNPAATNICCRFPGNACVSGHSAIRKETLSSGNGCAGEVLKKKDSSRPINNKPIAHRKQTRHSHGI